MVSVDIKFDLNIFLLYEHIMAAINPHVMNITGKQLETFGDVWKELLKQKVNIIHQISLTQGEDFDNLLTEFLPEAYDNKELWDKLFISNKSSDSNPSTEKIIDTCSVNIDKPSSKLVEPDIETDSSPITVKKKILKVKPKPILIVNKTAEIINISTNIKAPKKVLIIKK